TDSMSEKRTTIVHQPASAPESSWIRLPGMRRARSSRLSRRRAVTLTRPVASVRSFSASHRVRRVWPGRRVAGTSSVSKAERRSTENSRPAPRSSATRYQRPDFATSPQGSITRVEVCFWALRRYRMRVRSPSTAGCSTSNRRSPRYVAFEIAPGVLVSLRTGRSELAVPLTPRTCEVGLMMPGPASVVDVTFTRWASQGVRVVEEPYDDVFGRTFVVADPDGNLIRVSPVDGH